MKLEVSEGLPPDLFFAHEGEIFRGRHLTQPSLLFPILMEVLSVGLVSQVRNEGRSKFFLFGLSPVNVLKMCNFFKAYSEEPVGFDVLQGGSDVGVCYENHVEKVFL